MHALEHVTLEHVTLEALEAELARQHAVLGELLPRLDACDPEARVVLGAELEEQLEHVRGALAPKVRVPVGPFLRI
jgi:hypothetical protein